VAVGEYLSLGEMYWGNMVPERTRTLPDIQMRGEE